MPWWIEPTEKLDWYIFPMSAALRTARCGRNAWEPLCIVASKSFLSSFCMLLGFNVTSLEVTLLEFITGIINLPRLNILTVGQTHSLLVLMSSCREEIMIVCTEFSIGHELVETSIGIFKRTTKDTSPFSDVGNKTFYVPSVQERVSENQYE